jgi:hypothetical protein
MGVPTLEYSEYAEHIADVTQGGSMRPEYVSRFISRDKAELRAAIAELLAKKPLRGFASGDVLTDLELITAMAGPARASVSAPIQSTIEAR